MQVTQTHSDGLRREFKIVVPASDLEARLESRVSEIKDSVRLNGFRPGKVPPAHLKKIYGRSLMAEAIEALVEAHHAALYRYAFRLSGSNQEAEDLTQETFCLAQSKLHQLREQERAKSSPSVELCVGTIDRPAR